MTDSHTFLSAARAAALVPDPTLAVRITAAVEAATDPGERGRLHIALALAHQGHGEPALSAAAALAAVPHLLEAGEHGEAAYATGMGAAFVHATGDLARSVDLAVEAMVLLGDLGDDEHGVRTALVLASFFFQLAAFDLSVDLAKRAFDAAVVQPARPIDAVAYSYGYFAAEAGHVARDAVARERWFARAEEAAAWLCEHGLTDGSRRALGPGLHAEIAHGRGEPTSPIELDAGAAFYPMLASDLVAWHQLVRATAHHRGGDAHTAMALLDEAVPRMIDSGDNHCLVRALTERSAARAAVGDLHGALDDATDLARRTRTWQVEQVGRLASEVAQRVELQRTSTSLRSDVDRLLHDVSHDPTTGVHSRQWWDRRVGPLTEQGGPGFVALVDLDRFKQVNDGHGHLVGDTVLSRFGALLREAAQGVAVARFGGEEFVLAASVDDPERAVALAERIRLATQTHDWQDLAPGLHLTASVGVAFGDLGALRELLLSADEALLRAKRTGRNRVVVAAG